MKGNVFHPSPPSVSQFLFCERKPPGALLLRAKIDMKHPNMNMRDPPMRLGQCLGDVFSLGRR